eukprot:g2813.t1
MVLLDKLLIRLKKEGSRVLVFSQMTRQLDILEDYMNAKGYKYCRIDGGTSGESRDRQMDEFNAPGSEKFLFMLSTRAGGLGINLATADIVILYDSDWNPQVDLQAMDRAHRIGQKKQVRVFRFVTEKSVEEKIIERAERKLYLDAVVIQQGRLLQQNKKLSKDEINTMIKFGADEIFKSKGGANITDADIDAILKIGEKRTKDFKDKISTDMAHTLSSFKLEAATEEKSIYEYVDGDFTKSENGGTQQSFIALPQRERKSNYNVNDYFQNALSEGKKKSKKKRKPRTVTMFDFQFFQKKRINELLQIEFEWSEKRHAEIEKIKNLRTEAARRKRRANRGDEHVFEDVDKLLQEADERESALGKFTMPRKLRDELERLCTEGFSSWNKTCFRKVVAACEMYGRDAKERICARVSSQINKDVDEVRSYYDVFLERCRELSDWPSVEKKILKGEEKIARVAEVETLIRCKVESYKDPWLSLKFDYGPNKGKPYTEEEDRWLLCTVNEIGYGKWSEVRLRIRVAWQFRFDWWIKSRNNAEIQRRIDSLVRIIERENRERSSSRSSKKKKKTTSGKFYT